MTEAKDVQDDEEVAKDRLVQRMLHEAKQRSPTLGEQIGRFYRDLQEQGIPDGGLMESLVTEYAKAKMRLGC